MFYSITGKVILTEPGTVVIETGGIGYRLTVSGKTLGYAAENSGTENVSLFTYLSVREDAIELFGFYSKSELDMFKRLISVSGVGPKAAISILTQLSPAELGSAVISGDYKLLTKAPGIGKKIAERILLELKDKIAGGLSCWEENSFVFKVAIVFSYSTFSCAACWSMINSLSSNSISQ